MSGQSDGPGGKSGAPRQDGEAGRDLSFLWPAIDRIRAVEIKFTTDGNEDAATGAAAKPDFAARLAALESEVAALKLKLQGETDAAAAAARARSSAPALLRSVPACAGSPQRLRSGAVRRVTPAPSLGSLAPLLGSLAPSLTSPALHA